MRQRVVTALLLAIPCLLALALREPASLYVLAIVCAVIAGVEAGRLLNVPTPVMPLFTIVLSGAIYPPVFYRTQIRPGPSFPSLMTALLLIGALAAATPSRWIASGVLRVFAAMWIVPAFFAILALHRTAPGTGLWCLSPALMALVPVWAGDVAAILVGKAFGKHPLAPKISPKKTVEGSVGNLLAAVLAAWLLGLLLQFPDAKALGAGLAVGVMGQAGDLFESWLKRRAGVKDSGTLLPGHGGVLDRIDSVLFAAPAVALVLLG